MKLIDRERRLINRCIRRKLAWNAKLGVVTHPSGKALNSQGLSVTTVAYPTKARKAIPLSDLKIATKT